MKLLCVLVLVACGGSAKPPASPGSDRILVNVDADGVGLAGNDPMSYANGTPTAGVAEHASPYGGATYRFTTVERKAAFAADPKHYAPQYGGYCAYAASQNRLSVSDPQVFQIHEGQLLMFTNTEFRDLFNQDPAAHKRKADANWPGLVAKHGKPR